METDAKDFWKGNFGDSYTDRNTGEWVGRKKAFIRILKDLKFSSVLEVGCNSGHNLRIMRSINRNLDLCGVDINSKALDIARGMDPLTSFIGSGAAVLPFSDGSFDLVFTAGVLIHIPEDEFYNVIDEIYRVSNRYILMIEYFSEETCEVLYRGHKGKLWKRNFGEHFTKRFPSLKKLSSGIVGPEEDFDECSWWLFSKQEI